MLEIYVDGASRGNPGPATYAFILLENNNKIFEDSEFIGKATNNVAEYTGILNALKKANSITKEKVKVHSDSQLAVRQLNKKYQIKAKHLSKLANKVFALVAEFEYVEFIHVPRSNKFIQVCDKLCNERLNAEGY